MSTTEQSVDQKDRKVLWFEGAGIPGTGGSVGNCRIRTAFHADDGKAYYVELSSFEAKNKDQCPVARVDHAHEILGDDDENQHVHPSRHKMNFGYADASILNYINSAFGCSFDAIEVAPELSGYRVHRGNSSGTPESYNYGDEFVFDPVSTELARQISEREHERLKSAGVERPYVVVWRDAVDPMILHVHHPRAGFGSFDVRLDAPQDKLAGRTTETIAAPVPAPHTQATHQATLAGDAKAAGDAARALSTRAIDTPSKEISR